MSQTQRVSMPARLRNLILSVLLIAAAIGTWLLRPAESPDAQASNLAGTERGFYIRDAVFNGLDENGEVIYRLAAMRIEGSERTEQMSFHDVAISYGEDLEVPWRITAQTAHTQADGKVLELTGVVIQSAPESTGQPTRIEADTLELEAERQLARTTGPVTFAIGGSRLDAVGLTADLRNEQINLESNVSGRVAP